MADLQYARKEAQMGAGMEERQPAIKVENVKKIYKLYDKPSDRFKEAFGLAKNRHKEDRKSVV